MNRLKAQVILWFVLLLSGGVQADTAVFAGGCFWCVEAAYQDIEGVTGAVSGFTGGKLKNPTYSGNHRGHYEAVKVTYDPAVVSYEQLLKVFCTTLIRLMIVGSFVTRDPVIVVLFFSLRSRDLWQTHQKTMWYVSSILSWW